MRSVLLLGAAAACTAPPAGPVREGRVNVRETARAALTEADEAPGYHGGIPDGSAAEFHDAIGDPDRVVPWVPRRGLMPFMPGEPTPELVHSFLGLDDDNRSVPPDTMGAVGPDHLVVTLNTQVRVQDRAGGELSTVTLDSFWRDVGADAFDPRVFYDHFEDRWITVAVGDARTEQSAVLLGVTDDDDPEADWTLRRYDADAGDQTWADFPVLGFNRRWIAIQNNMFDFDGDFLRGDLWVLDKADLYAGGDGNPRVIDIGRIGTLAPAVVYDSDQEDLPCVAHWSGRMEGRGWIRLYRITGPTDSPELEEVEFASVEQPWDFAPPDHADFAPQAGSDTRVQNNDARIQSVVQREGSVWAVHTNFLPAGGPDRAAVRFWELGLDATVRQTGLIDGAGEGRHYAFPSLAVNASRDVLIGFSEFGRDIFPGAAYAFRSNRDLLGEVRGVHTLREGQASYTKSRSGRNRWGDYSATVVDPVDDQTLWTLQEYAAAPEDGADRFGVWWGAMTPPGAPPIWRDPGEPEVDEGELLDLVVQADDADGDSLTYSAERLPEGAELDDGRDPPHLLWTPSFDHAGKHEVALAVTDGGRIVRVRFEVTVNPVDRPPTLADPGDRQVRQLERLTIDLDGRDPDGDAVSFAVDPLPAGASLDVDTGRFSWMPLAADLGDHELVFTVTAGGLHARRAITVTVAGLNRPPVLVRPDDVVIDEGEQLVVVVEASDPDGDDVTLLFDPMPVGALLDEDGALRWLVGFDQEGVHQVLVTATDGTLADAHTWRIEVRDVNRPPEFVPVGPQQLAEGEQMLFFAEAVDPDGDEVALSAEQLPGAAQFNPDTGACMWNAGFGAAGEWMVVLGASDGDQLALLRVPVTIDDVNRPPVLDAVEAPAAAEGQALELALTASDPDGDDVSVQVLQLPDGAGFDPGEGLLAWTPGFEQAGRHLLTVRASDGELEDEALLVIDVADTNRPPELDTPIAVDVREGAQMSVDVVATDPDGDLLLLALEEAPAGARLSPDGELTWRPTHEDAGDHVVIVAASDGDLDARAPITVRVADVDRPPTMAPVADARVAEGEELVVALQAEDPDGDPLVYGVAGPEGMAVEGGQVRWTPGFDAAGEHAVVVTAEAGGESVERGFSVVVLDTDRPPTLEITGDPAAGREGEALALTLVGEDPDGDEVRYGSAALPAGATLDERSGELAWTPGFAQAGVHPVVFLAMAGGAVVRRPAELVVADVDRPPTLEIRGPEAGLEGAALQWRLIAEDPDGASLSVDAPALPRGAELDGFVIRWTPDFEQAGEHTLEATVSDGTSQAEAELTVRIEGVNRPPEITPPDDESVKEDEALRIALQASDPDGDELTFRATGLPPAATLHRTLGTLNWTPGFDDAGEYAVEVTVSDGELSAHAELELTVRDVNRPPTVIAPSVHHVQSGNALVFSAIATDPDGDELTVSVVPLPRGASIDASGGEFRWTPAAGDAGQHDLKVTVSDGALTASTDVTIFVSKTDEGGCRTVPVRRLPLALRR